MTFTEIAKIFGEVGSVGWAAFMSWMWVKKDRELGELNKVFRESITGTARELSRALTEQNLLTKQQVERLTQVLERLKNLEGKK